jgi:hypothetical protein
MLRAMTTTVCPHPVAIAAPAADTRRAGWVSEYRRKVPAADRWARGLPDRAHSIETQDRIFRMAEQLTCEGTDCHDLFSRLEEADGLVARAADSKAVAKAGYQTIAPLLALTRDSMLIGDGGRQPDLRAVGFNPIPFDDHDPAAYAWVMFELTVRAREDAGGQSQPSGSFTAASTAAP